MAKTRIVLKNDFAAAVEAAAAVLRAGGVLAFPTETVYGIGVASGDAVALAKLRRLKKRDAAKPFQFLAADIAMAEQLGAVVPARAQRLARAHWPGPMTLVLPGAPGAPTLGIRIPDSPFVLSLCRKLGKAIISSSANPAGENPALDADEADAFGDEVDLLVDGGGIAGGVPSTVVNCAGGDYEILRRGALSEKEIEAAWRE